MARAGKAEAAAPAPAEKPAAKPEKPAKPAVEKAATPAAEKAAKPAAASAAASSAPPRDTSSILSAARAGTKPGPVPKSQAPAAVKERAAAAKERVAVPPMPVKPDYARPKPTPIDTPVERRGFMKFVSGALSLSVGSAFAIGNT